MKIMCKRMLLFNLKDQQKQANNDHKYDFNEYPFTLSVHFLTK